MFNYYYLLPLLIAGYYYIAKDRTTLCKVVSVQDGDSIRAVCDGIEMKIRLVCIDAPELKQDWGIESRNYLKKLIKKQNKEIKVKLLKTDRYGRTLAELYDKEGKMIQLQLIEQGMAWGYIQYKTGCSIWYKILVAEDEAKDKKIGLWSAKVQIEPWKWRKQNQI